MLGKTPCPLAIVGYKLCVYWERLLAYRDRLAPWEQKVRPRWSEMDAGGQERGDVFVFVYVVVGPPFHDADFLRGRNREMVWSIIGC